MQVKKNEMKDDILHAAEEEFFYHGYKSSSLRNIAKKANTTLGNLYHYFSSKEVMLEGVLEDYPDEIMKFISNHHDDAEFIPKEEITYNTLLLTKDYLDKYAGEISYMDMLADKRSVILLQGCTGTRYEHYNQEIRSTLRAHMAQHYIVDKDSLFLQTLVDSIVDTVVSIVKKNKNSSVARNLVLQYISLISLGMTCQLMFEK